MEFALDEASQTSSLKYLWPFNTRKCKKMDHKIGYSSAFVELVACCFRFETSL